jgi:tRNA(fMet)-specific endonuclease VapC
MIVFDSDIFTLFSYGHEKIKHRYDAAQGEKFAVTIITRIEVLKGRTDSLLKAADKKELQTAIQRLQHTESVLERFAVLPMEAAAVEHFGKWLKKLTKMRRADLLIACIALAQKALLVTRNTKDFKGVPGLRIENWAD